MIVMGQGVWSPFYVGSSMDGMEKKYGRARIIDTPVSENAVTAMAFGASTLGHKTLVIHPRMDFMILSMDPIVNTAAKWRYSLNFKTPTPFTVRAIINRGGEQGAQHSQALHSWFAHIPGLRVVMPSSPQDAYELLRQSIDSPDPVIFIEDRWSYSQEMEFEIKTSLPELSSEMPRILSVGQKLTAVGVGHSTNILKEAIKLANLENEVELVDLRILQPLNIGPIKDSARKTGKLLVLDGGWRNSGVAAEIIASVVESPEISLKAPAARLTLTEAPAPTSPRLESAYYQEIESVAKKMLEILAQ
jgi:pyruvate dehydrogenase E1 component beta subunit